MPERQQAPVLLGGIVTVPTEASIGEKAVRDGTMAADRVDACQEIRNQIRALGLQPPAIGQIALSMGWIGKSELASLYGPRPAQVAGPRRSFRDRAAAAARTRARRSTALFLLFTVLGAGGSLLIEWVLRTRN